MPSTIEISFKQNSFLILLCLLFNQILSAQCTNGNQPECTCETAPVLCTVDELDGYVFSMSAYMHPQDGPTPICQSEPSSQTNNPTWFAFTAWCTNLTLRATPSNCNEFQNIVGVQIAIYEDCSFDNEVACDVDIQDCNVGAKVLNMSGLTIGKVYYFMVDGCLGSYCRVTIDVVGVCGEEVIAPWTMPVTGDMNPCVGVSETYTVQQLNGAGLYYWYLDGVVVNQSPSNSFTTTWTTPGSYQLCIDASNDPCVPVTDDPLPLCATIVVHEADAGVLNVSPTAICRNGLIDIASTAFTPGAANTQVILMVDAAGYIVDVINAATGTFTTSISGTYTVYAYNYISTAGTIPTIGMHIGAINCFTGCCDLENVSITVTGIDAVVNNVICSDNGTDYDPADDTYTFDLLVTGHTPGFLWRSSDGTLNGTYGSILQCGPYAIDGGWLDFNIHDYDIPTCSTTISIEPPPSCSACIQTIDAGPDGSIDCANDMVTLQGESSEPGTFRWTGPDGFQSNLLMPVVIDSGVYYLTADFLGLCTFKDSVFVDIDTISPIANAGPDLLIDCIQTEVFLDGSASTGQHLQWEWIAANGELISLQPTLMVNVGGIYILQLTNSSNGCISADTVVVMVDPNTPEAIEADIISENCIGENNGMIDVTGVPGGTPPFTYVLNGQVTNSSGQFTDLDPGNYTLHITDSKGCMIDTFFTIHEGLDLQLELPSIMEFIIGHASSIQASVNVPVAELSSIQWTPPGLLSCDTCLITSIVASGNHTFLLTVVHQNGCMATAEISITVVPETEIYIPNVFSPNGDGINDYFTLYSNERVDEILKLSVYDRWGELVYHREQFSPNEESAGWDGTFKGKKLMPSIFVYAFEVLLADGTSQIISGDVTLLR